MKRVARVLFGLGFVAVGILHFVRPAPFVAIVPPYLPWPLALVYISGAAEVLLGTLLLIPRWSAWAAWGLIALLIAVFPANLNMALNADRFPGIPASLLWWRLPLQAVLIGIAYLFTAKEKR